MELSSLNTQSAIPQMRPKTLESSKQRRYDCKTTCRRRRPVESCLDEMPSGPRLAIALPRAAISHAFAKPYHNQIVRVLAGPYSKGYQQECRQHAEACAYRHLK